MQREINITFQEEDRQKAKPYTEGNDCLVATALKRLGHKDIQCSAITHYINGFYYFSLHTHSGALYAIPHSMCGDHGPYYGPEVVGKQVTLILNED